MSELLGQDWMTHLVARAKFEGDVLSYSRGRPIRPRLVSFLLPKLCPVFTLGDCVVHDRLLQYPFDLAGDLYDTLAELAGWGGRC